MPRTMPSNSRYSRKVSKDVVIENGIMKGAEKTYSIDCDSVGEIILKRMRAKPEFVGQIDGTTGKEETFREMEEKSVRCALWMREQGVEVGDIVGICTHNQMDMYIPCFASLYIGAVFNPWWEAGLTKEVAKYFIALTKPKVIFLTEITAGIVLEAIEEIGTKIPLVLFGENTNHLSLNAILKSQHSIKVADFRCTKLPSKEEPVIILYTSGSTGLPKGVVCSNKSLLTNIHHFANMEVDDLEVSVTLQFSPLFWLSGAYGILRGIIVPDRRIIHPEYTPENCLKLIEKYKVNWLLLGSGASSALEKCSEISKYDLSSLKFFLYGGSAVSQQTQTSLLELLPQVFVCQAYGSTELGSVGVRHERGYKAGSCGRVTENHQLKVIDPKSGRILNPNETGEACFRNPYIMTGYYKNPTATSETIDSEGWLHTGDLAYYDEEGYFFFLERSKELIKFRGYHVSPTMIENVLLQHPAVQESAVVSIPHEIDEQHPIGFVTLESGHQISEEAIEKMVSDTLPDYMKLRGGVKFLDKMPHTPTGKIARQELRTLAMTYIQ